MTCALTARSRPTASSRPPEVRLPHSRELSRHCPRAISVCRPIPSLCDSGHIYRFSALTSSDVGSHDLQIFPLLSLVVHARSQTPFKHSTLLLEWHRSFAWYPVPLVRKGKLRYAWLQFVERKWGISRYSGTMKWRYRPRTALTNEEHWG